MPLKVYSTAPWQVTIESGSNRLTFSVAKSRHVQRTNALNYGPDQATAFIVDQLHNELNGFAATDRGVDGPVADVAAKAKR